MRAYERFLKYAKIHTASAEEQGVTPSTPCQFDLARLLVDELKALGLENPSVDENCIVTAWLPAAPTKTPGCSWRGCRWKPMSVPDRFCRLCRMACLRN